MQYALILSLSLSHDVEVIFHPKGQPSRVIKKLLRMLKIKNHNGFYTSSAYSSLAAADYAITMGSASVVDFLYFEVPVIEIGRTPRVIRFQRNYYFFPDTPFNYYRLLKFVKVKNRWENGSWLPAVLNGFIQKDSRLKNTDNPLQENLTEHKNFLSETEVISLLTECKDVGAQW